MALLHSKNKFNISSVSKERSVNTGEFFNWSNNNMYRTSYHDMSQKVLVFFY